MKTLVFLIAGKNAQLRARQINQLLLDQQQSGAKKITLMASAEILATSDAQTQADMFRLDEKRKAQGICVLRLSSGCLCCSSKLVLTTHLARTLRLTHPDVLVIEMHSQSHPPAVLNLLKETQWKNWFKDIIVWRT